MELIDLSVTLEAGPGNSVPVNIDYMSHDAGGAHLAQLVGIPQCCLSGGKAWASERISAITHSGTHIDAPFHYSPTTGVARSRTIDEMPLEWFWGPGKCIHVCGPTEMPVGPDELLEFEQRKSIIVGIGDIVLFRTDADLHWQSSDYNSQGRGLSPELVRLLITRGVKVFGTDAWSIDPPYWVMKQRLSKFGASEVWGAHFVGREHEFCAIEKLSNLRALPADGFHVACFPVKVAKGSAGWARVVAFVPDGGQASLTLDAFR